MDVRPSAELNSMDKAILKRMYEAYVEKVQKNSNNRPVESKVAEVVAGEVLQKLGIEV
jgi:hypothetical protein